MNLGLDLQAVESFSEKDATNLEKELDTLYSDWTAHGSECACVMKLGIIGFIILHWTNRLKLLRVAP